MAYQPRTLAFETFGGSRPVFGTRFVGPSPTQPSTPIGGSGGGTSLGDELTRRGLDVLEDLIRSKLIPGNDSGNTTPPVPGNFSPDVAPASCPEGTIRIGTACIDLIPGGSTSGGGMVLSTGEAINGRYGAGQAPQVRARNVARCGRGMVLGMDGVCYDRRAIKNSERKWPRGRKPLLTGGDLRAISKASRAASRMKDQNSRLVSLGLLKKPSSAPKHGKGCACDTCLRISAARNGR